MLTHMSYVSESVSYAPAGARDARDAARAALRSLNADRERRRVAGDEIVSAEQHVTFALQTYAQHARESAGARKSHVRLRHAQRLQRAQRSDVTTNDLAPADLARAGERSRFDSDESSYDYALRTRQLTDPDVAAFYRERELSDSRSERARAARAGDTRRRAERDSRDMLRSQRERAHASRTVCESCFTLRSVAGVCECDM